MNKNGNTYTFIYASVMVIIVAFILTSLSILLKDRIDSNIKMQKMKMLLASVNVESSSENAQDIYSKHLMKEMVIDIKGKLLSDFDGKTFSEGEKRAFDIDLKIELKNIERGGGGNLPLFVFEKAGKKFYVIPVQGKGLWGPIWGNIALNEDFITIAGVNFDHKGETPGLGSEINTKEFQSQFVGKKIFNDKNEFTSVKAVKGGIESSKDVEEIHGVDAISGGTITSDGLNDMIYDCLIKYEPYLKEQIDGSGK